ncbi:MAG: SMP-30/gluconolactonase/LRE family protein, partial [Pseudomonadota bacterium]
GGGGGSAGGGRSGTGGGATGGAGVAGGAGNVGSGGNVGSVGWTCPAASSLTGSPLPSGASATRIAGVPPTDVFNMNMFMTIEGPVWIGDALYVSELKTGDLPQARILKITSNDVVSIFLADSGSNGLAVNKNGDIVSANQGVQGIVQIGVAGQTKTTLVSMYNAKKFNAPNDLAIRSDGTIYFTDPTHQNNGNPQAGTRVYQLPPGAPAATVITDYTNNPNGVTLSLDEQTLFVAGGSGVKKYAITAGGVAMTGEPFGPPEIQNINTDGMAIDCAGDIYATVGNNTNVFVVSPTGTKIGMIPVVGPSAATNVAFGGSDHKTLYVTGQGSSGQQGVFKVQLNFPGMPY